MRCRAPRSRPGSAMRTRGMCSSGWIRSLGVRAEPLSPGNPRFGRPLPPWRARLTLAEPIARVEDVETAVGHLLAELCPRLEREGRGARRLELMLFRTDATLERSGIGTSRPSRDAAHLSRLFAEALADLSIGPDRRRRHRADRARGRRHRAPVAGPTRARPPRRSLDSRHRPARRPARRSPGCRQRDPPRPPGKPPARTRRRASPHAGPRHGGHRLWRKETGRSACCAGPSRCASTLTGHDLPERFEWRRARYDVVRAEGPERIAPEWWREDGADGAGGPPRDYFRIEERAGGRFWLFRSGDEWFLHGRFA